MTDFAKKWKRAEIYKRNSAGGLKAEKKNMIVATQHLKANIGVVLTHQYYQQILRRQEQQLICCVKKVEKTTHMSGRASITNILVYS